MVVAVLNLGSWKHPYPQKVSSPLPATQAANIDHHARRLGRRAGPEPAMAGAGNNLPGRSLLGRRGPRHRLPPGPLGRGGEVPPPISSVRRSSAAPAPEVPVLAVQGSEKQLRKMGVGAIRGTSHLSGRLGLRVRPPHPRPCSFPISPEFLLTRFFCLWFFLPSQRSSGPAISQKRGRGRGGVTRRPGGGEAGRPGAPPGSECRKRPGSPCLGRSGGGRFPAAVSGGGAAQAAAKPGRLRRQRPKGPHGEAADRRWARPRRAFWEAA